MSVAVGIREDVASVARLLSRAGLVEAFGHVSARLKDGGFAVTPTRPLLGIDAGDVLELDQHGNVLAGEGCPLEAPLHAAIYAVRPEVGAICRTHSPYAAAWAARCEVPPLIHGLGGLAGAVACHDSPQLVTDERAGASAARALGRADCLLLRANGAVCTAPDLARAAVRAWFLEERSRVANRAAGASALTDAELTERSQHFEAETARAWSWLQARFRETAGAELSTAYPKEER